MKMPSRDPDSYGLLVWGLITAMSIWGGLVKYIVEVRRNNQAWSWIAALGQVVVSGFAGLIGGLLVIESGLSIYYTLVAAGMSGTMGSAALNYFWERLTGVRYENQ